MEFWILILTLWAFYRWVQSRIRSKSEDERFARVIESLNLLEARQDRFNNLEARIQELERRLISTSASPAPETSAAIPFSTLAIPKPSAVTSNFPVTSSCPDHARAPVAGSRISD